jgi:hypothetical protein
MGTLGRKAVWGAALALWVMVPAASASSERHGKVDGDNIVWGTLSDDNIVWGTSESRLTISLKRDRGGL